MAITKYQLKRIATEREKAVLKAYSDSIASIRDIAVLTYIENMIAAGNIDKVIDFLQLDTAAFSTLDESIRQSYIIGGQTGAAQIGSIPVTDGTLVARFNIQAPAAQEWLSSMSSRLVVEIVEQQRNTIKQVLVESLTRGDNPRTAALDLVGRIGQNGKRQGGFIGLTQQQAGWVSNARQELQSLDANYLSRALRDKRFDSTIQKAIRTGKPIPKSTIDSAITQMQNRAQRYRAETIARTESINALRSGQWQAVEQAAQESETAPDTVKVWDSSSDSRTRQDHALADGQERPLDQPFSVGGYPMMYPGDSSLGAPASQTIQCRCQALYRVKWGAIARRVDGFA